MIEHSPVNPNLVDPFTEAPDYGRRDLCRNGNLFEMLGELCFTWAVLGWRVVTLFKEIARIVDKIRRLTLTISVIECNRDFSPTDCLGQSWGLRTITGEMKV